MPERLTDEQVAWYAGTSRSAKWTADMAVHENIVTLAREVQAHRSACECAPVAEYPHELFCPSIDVCAFCSGSECDGIGCISDLNPDDLDDQPRLEQIQAWVRLGRIAANLWRKRRNACGRALDELDKALREARTTKDVTAQVAALSVALTELGVEL